MPQQQMTLDQWYELAADLAAAFPAQPLPDATVTSWFQDLACYPVEVVAAAVRHCRRERAVLPPLAVLLAVTRSEHARLQRARQASRAAVAPPAPRVSAETRAALRRELARIADRPGRGDADERAPVGQDLAAAMPPGLDPKAGGRR